MHIDVLCMTLCAYDICQIHAHMSRHRHRHSRRHRHRHSHSHSHSHRHARQHKKVHTHKYTPPKSLQTARHLYIYARTQKHPHLHHHIRWLAICTHTHAQKHTHMHHQIRWLAISPHTHTSIIISGDSPLALPSDGVERKFIDEAPSRLPLCGAITCGGASEGCSRWICHVRVCMSERGNVFWVSILVWWCILRAYVHSIRTHAQNTLTFNHK